MLTNLSVANFRGHKKTGIDLARWTILYGGNGAGKSSLLDALNMMSSFITGAHVKHVFPGGVFSLGSQLNDPNDPQVTMEVRHLVSGFGVPTEVLAYSVTFEQLNNGNAQAVESLLVDGAEQLPLTPQAKTLLGTSACADAEAADDLRTAHRFARRYRLEPRALRETSSSHHFIEKNGYGLASSMDHLRQSDPAALDALLDDFIDLFPDVVALRPVIVGSGDTALEFDTAHALNLSGAHLSDGQSLALGLLFLAHAQGGPRLLLLDEPEVTLSPIVVKNLLSKVDAALGPERQVVTTTHSPYVMQWGIHSGAEVRQVRPDLGTRTWQESLHQQGISADTFHSATEPICVPHCCALLETYLTA